MICDKTASEISKLLNDELRGKAREDLLLHLNACSACRERLEESLREPALETAFSEYRDRMERTKVRFPAARENRRIPLIRSKVFRIAAAAVLILTISPFIFFPGMRQYEPNAVYAAMMEALEKIVSVKFTQTNNYGVENIHQQSHDGRWHREVKGANGYRSTAIYDGHTLAWFSPGRKYVDLQINPYRDYKLPTYWEAIRDKVVEDKVVERKFLGTRVIDGIEALGYDVRLRDMRAFTDRREEIWVDAVNHLPVRVISRSVFCYASLDEDSLKKEKDRLAELVRRGVWSQKEMDGLLKDNMIPKEVVDTYCDFHWNLELEDSLFVIEIPQGWTSQNR